jgi:predicted RNA-binding protein Jag
MSGNPYYDSMRENNPNQKIISQQTNEELEKKIKEGSVLMSKEILEQVKDYLNVLLGEMTAKGKTKASVTKSEIEIIVKNIQDHLNQCY